MDFHELVDARHCVRVFLDEPVPDEAVEAVVRVACLAPSAMNLQPTRLHVATGDARRRIVEVMALSTVHLSEYVSILPQEQLDEAARFFSTLGDAPVVVALTIPRDEDELTRLNSLIATGCVIQNMLLAAVDVGLGACPVSFGFWVRDELRQAIGADPGREVVALLLLGKPSGEPEAPPHRTDIVELVE